MIALFLLFACSTLEPRCTYEMVDGNCEVYFCCEETPGNRFCWVDLRAEMDNGKIETVEVACTVNYSECERRAAHSEYINYCPVEE